MVQQYLWKGGGANWLWSALIDNCWIFEEKANFFSFGGCWVKILVPHSAVFLIQKAKTWLRGIVEGDTSLKKCLNARRRRGEGLFAIVCWQWRNLNIKRQPTEPLLDFCFEYMKIVFFALSNLLLPRAQEGTRGHRVPSRPVPKIPLKSRFLRS